MPDLHNPTLERARMVDDLLVDDQLVVLLQEAQSYRTLAQEAIHALHELQLRFDRQEQAYHRALDELKAQRGEQRVAA